MGPAAFLLALISASAAPAETLTGRVVGISDGDTLTVLVSRQPVKVKLADIDAPEITQAYGVRSKQALSDLCFQRDARLETAGQDRYGRTVATVDCSGKNANAEQVWQGMAWVFDRYAKPEAPLYVLQGQAKAASRGLWNEPNPTAPWEGRKHERDRKGVAPSEPGSRAVQAQPQAPPRRWVCHRKEVAGQPHAMTDCGWRCQRQSKTDTDFGRSGIEF